MLKDITLSNKTFIPAVYINYRVEKDTNVKVCTSGIGPIRLNPRKYSVNKTIGPNDLVVTIDGKDHICSDLNVMFSPGRTPTKVKLDNLEEITWEGKEVEKEERSTTLEIAAIDPTTNLNEDAPLSGWHLGPIKINDFKIPYVGSLELFTEDTILKARIVFAVDHIKFTGVNVETEASYYKEPSE